MNAPVSFKNRTASLSSVAKKINNNSLFGSGGAETKNIDDDLTITNAKAVKQIATLIKSLEKQKEDKTKMLTYHMKNPRISYDSDKEPEDRMSPIIDRLGQLTTQIISTKLERTKLQAAQNAPMDLSKVIGKIVHFNDNVKSFVNATMGVKYNYKIAYNKNNRKNLRADIKVYYNIYNSDGQLVYKTSAKKPSGKHSFSWNGECNEKTYTDEEGHQMKVAPPGEYSFKVSADIVDQNNQKLISAYASTESVGGTIRGVILNKDNVVTKVMVSGDGDQDSVEIDAQSITGVYDVENDDQKDLLKIDGRYIGRLATLDLSKASIEDGVLDVNYRNHLECPGNIKVQIFNADDKIMRYPLETLISKAGKDGKISVGPNNIVFNKLKLDDGRYKVKVFIENIKNEQNNPHENPEEEVVYNHVAVIAGLNIDGKKFRSKENQYYNIYNITDISNTSRSSIEEKIEMYENSVVEYEDDEFSFNSLADMTSEKLLTTFVVPKESNEVISYGVMSIYNKDTNTKLMDVRGYYSLYNMLDRDSKKTIDQYLLDNGGLSIQEIYDDAPKEKEHNISLIKLNEYIKNEIKKENISISDQCRVVYNSGSIDVIFDWDRITLEQERALLAKGSVWTREFYPVYIDYDNNQIIKEREGRHRTLTKTAEVKSAKITENNKFEITLANDQVISEDKVCSKEFKDSYHQRIQMLKMRA